MGLLLVQIRLEGRWDEDLCVKLASELWSVCVTVSPIYVKQRR